MAKAPDDQHKRGPWSNLAARPAKPPTPMFRTRQSSREPLVNNWRNLAIIAFLLLVAPVLVAWVSRFIIGLIPGTGG